MPVISVYCSGVSTTGIELINKAVVETFGECNVEELGRDNLRTKVRIGYRDTSVALIILDTASMEECKDFARGLYSSDKFYHYESDKKLVEFLNKKYDLNLEPIEDELSVPNISTSNNQDIEDVRNELIEKYTSQLNDKDSIIQNLKCTIIELNNIITGEGYSTTSENSSLKEEVDKLTVENLNLKNTISDMEVSYDKEKDKVDSGIKKIDELNNTISSMQNNYGKLEDDYKNINEELGRVRSESSLKSGVLRDKDKEISKLNDKVTKLEKDIENLVTLEDDNKSLKNTLKSKDIDIKSKDDEINRLKSEILNQGKLNSQVENYKSLLSESDKAKSEKEKQLVLLEEKYDELLNKYNTLSDTSESTIAELQEKYEKSDKSVTKLNIEKINLENRVKVLEQSSDRNNDFESTLSELTEIRNKYASLKVNIFNTISTKAMPYQDVKVPLIKSIINYLKNITFVFSGNTESRKGTYKCIFDKLNNDSSQKYIIVDVVSETAIDYVFQMKDIVDGMKWFTVGGGVQNYLSHTCIPNVQVLMPKVGYVNDSYFLTVNWEKRLNELENSGYKVIIYCGDISNLIGRVLFESFAELGNTDVYVHGNVLGSRAVLANAKGLKGIKNSNIKYFDFNKDVSKFYDAMKKRYNCEIISYLR